MSEQQTISTGPFLSLGDLGESDRLHFSPESDLQLKGGYGKKLKPDFKPVGLWWSVGIEWAEWSISEQFRQETLAHVYRLHLDEARILKATKMHKLIRLHDDFGCQRSPGGSTYRYHDNVDWPMMATLWSGVEIAPYQWSMRHDWQLWYYSWDVASGCVWDLDCIQRLEYLGELDPELIKLKTIE